MKALGRILLWSQCFVGGLFLPLRGQMTIVTAALPEGMEMVPYEAQLVAEGGLAPYRWSTSGTVLAWGYNWDGQMNVPLGLNDVVAVSAGAYHSIALRADGTVAAWGANWEGQTGIPPGLNTVVAISAGYSHNLAIKADGSVVAWGSNSNGQAQVPSGLSEVIAVSAGSYHSLALKADGTVVAWGAGTVSSGSWPDYGQSIVPAGLGGVVAIAAGDLHSVALTSDGSVVAWGAGTVGSGMWPDYGQSRVPAGLTDVVAIAAGISHSLALRVDGTVQAWGDSWSGQASVPADLSNVVSISAGGDQSLASRSDGTVVTWGWKPPVNLTLEGAVSVSLGYYHNLAVRPSTVPPGLLLGADGRIVGTPLVATNTELTSVARDRSGRAVWKTIPLTVASNPNTRPVITQTSPLSSRFLLLESLSQSFFVLAHDPEGKPLTYHWFLDGVKVSGSGNSFTWQTAWGDAGGHTVEVEVHDDLWTNGVARAAWEVVVLDDNDGDGTPNEQEVDLNRDPFDPLDGGTKASLAGVVTGAGVPLEGAWIELQGAGGTVYHSTRTAVDGSFGMNGIEPGTYYKIVRAADFKDMWHAGAGHRELASGFLIAAGTDITGLRIDLEPGQSPAILSVVSDPAGAEIYVDYWPTGQVTPALVDLGEIDQGASHVRRVASHVITLRKSGSVYPVPRTISAVEAETVEEFVDLTSTAAGSVEIFTVPAGATAYVDVANTAVGFTPVTVGNLAPGSHVILLHKEGYLRPRPVIVWVVQGQLTPVSVPLTPADQPAIQVDSRSIPPDMEVWVDYLPTGQVTDVVLADLDPASHSGTGWRSASHTLLLRKQGFRRQAARWVDEHEALTPGMMQHMVVDEVSATDLNGNGLPDQWESVYELGDRAPGKSGAQDDADGDGMTNEAEMLAGTDPLLASSRIEVDIAGVSVQSTGGQVTLVFRTVPGRRYLVQTTQGLNQAWSNASGVFTAVDDQSTVTLQIPPGETPSFYRLLGLDL